MIRKLFRQMLVTQILSAMTVTLCMLIDSIMIGRFLGVNAMTAYGLASPVLLVFAAFGSMLSAGVQVMCGKTVGNGDREGTNACFSASVFLAAAVSIVGLAAVLLFASPLCTLLGAGTPGADNEVFGLTRDYLTGFIIGAPAFIAAQIMVPYMQLSGNRTRLVVAVALMTVGDVLFDILNVFIFKGGTFGMGLASSLSYYVAFVAGVLYFFRKDCMFRFQKKLIKGKICRELTGYGVPTVINQISLVLLVFVLNKILLAVGQNAAVAAYSVISTVGNICYCFGGGVASVALLLSSVFYSEEDRSALYAVVRTMSFYAVLLDVVLIAAVWIAAPALVALFLEDATASQMAVLGVRLFSLSLLPSALNSALKNYYQGVDRTRFTETISVLQNFTFTAVFAFVLSRFMGTTGVWLSYVCGETVTLVIICIVVWRTNRKVRIDAEDFALLPDSFGAEQGACLELSITSADQVISASEQAAAFCQAHGESRRDSMLMALCIEEMANNIIEHGFTADGRDHTIDVRLLFKEGKRILRIRDNCVNFDPVKYMDLHSSDDPMAHIGIRMVMKMVRDATYVNSMGLNNLTLVL